MFVRLRRLPLLRLDGRCGLLVPESVLTSFMAANVSSSWCVFALLNATRTACKLVERKRLGNFVLTLLCSVARRLSRISNLSTGNGGRTVRGKAGLVLDSPTPTSGTFSFEPPSSSSSSSSVSSRGSSNSSSRNASVTFKTHSLGFPLVAISCKHSSDAGRSGSSR